MAYIYLNPLKQQLEDARRQRAMLDAQRQQLAQSLASITQQIAQWDAYINATAPLAEANEPPQPSLADFCRMALDAFGGQWVTAKQVRDYLVQIGVQFNYSNQMAVLHNTLQRVAQTTRNGGTTLYAAKR
jgi:hypothetical protein